MLKKLFLVLFSSLLFTACNNDKEDEEVSVFSNDLEVGASAEAFLLQEEEFPTIEIEVAYTEDFQPLPESLQNLKDFAAQHTQKEVFISPNEIDLASKESFSLEEIKALENQFRLSENEEEKISVFLLFLPGSFAENSAENTQLGKAYKNTSMVVFEKEILNMATTETDQKKLESTIATHQFSHLLGLVNKGLPSINEHENQEFSGHCLTQNCLMQAATNFADNSDFLLSNNLQLKSYCLEDLAAFKNAN